LFSAFNSQYKQTETKKFIREKMSMFISEKKPSVFSATTSKKQSLKSKLQQENRNGNIESSKSRSRKRSGSFESSMKKPSANGMSLKAQLEQEKQRSRKSLATPNPKNPKTPSYLKINFNSNYLF